MIAFNLTSRFSRRWISCFRCNAMKTAVAALSTLTLSGCFGVAALYNDTTNYEAASIYLGEKGECCSTIYNAISKKPENRERLLEPAVSTKAEIIERWGQPDKQWTDGDSEKWQYFKEGASAVGIMLAVVIPIPMFMPSAHNSTTFIFTDGKLTSAEVVDGKFFIAGCGAFLLDFSPIDIEFGCHYGDFP